MTDAVERQLVQLLEAHELVKGKVLENAMLTPRTVSEALCEATGDRAGAVHRFQIHCISAGADKDKRKIVLVK